MQIEKDMVEIGFATRANPFSTNVSAADGFDLDPARMQETEEASVSENAAGPAYDGLRISLSPVPHDHAYHRCEHTGAQAGSTRILLSRQTAPDLFAHLVHGSLCANHPVKSYILRCS